MRGNSISRSFFYIFRLYALYGGLFNITALTLRSLWMLFCHIDIKHARPTKREMEIIFILYNIFFLTIFVSFCYYISPISSCGPRFAIFYVDMIILKQFSLFASFFHVHSAAGYVMVM